MSEIEVEEAILTLNALCRALQLDKIQKKTYYRDIDILGDLELVFLTLKEFIEIHGTLEENARVEFVVTCSKIERAIRWMEKPRRAGSGALARIQPSAEEQFSGMEDLATVALAHRELSFRDSSMTTTSRRTSSTSLTVADRDEDDDEDEEEEERGAVVVVMSPTVEADGAPIKLQMTPPGPSRSREAVFLGGGPEETRGGGHDDGGGDSGLLSLERTEELGDVDDGDVGWGSGLELIAEAAAVREE